MWPKNVGIQAIEVYFPAQYVDQTELEKFDGVSAGKYTVGLGQSRMGFCNDREDIHSLCLTVTQRLMERYNVDPHNIGRLEVGTETLLDRSKSTKSVLMQLFEPYGCTDIEGVDCSNACYGGTAALFNAVDWIESSAWDGRLALVVAADNAVYSKGRARPTGGAGAIAMLVGPDAPLVLDRGIRASSMRHSYDFYKPDVGVGGYPVVDGKLSIQCYLNALDDCYQRYREKVLKKQPDTNVDLTTFDAILFHSPYCKLVQKSFARLAFIDFLNTPKDCIAEKYPGLEKFHGVKLEDMYFDREVEKNFLKLSEADFLAKTQPTLLLANQIGNMYTASVYSGLVSLLVTKPTSALAGMKIGVFSYGSGLCSSMYSLTVTDNFQDWGLTKIVSALSYVKSQLETRRCASPEEYTRVLELREQNWHVVPFSPESSTTNMFPGTYYLVQVDEKYRRTYERTETQQLL